MTYLVSVNDLQNKQEEEALALFRDIEYESDPKLAIRFLKMLLDYDIEMQEREFDIPEIDE